MGSEFIMARLKIRNLSADSNESHRRRAEKRGCSREELARSILDEAAGEIVELARFPHEVIAAIEPGIKIEPLLQVHEQPQRRVDLP